MVLLVAALLPGLFWDRGPETAPAIRAAGIERLYVPAQQAEAWRAAGLNAAPLDEASIRRFEKLTPPRVQMRMNIASATRQPWIDANGWRFERRPEGHYWYDLPAGAAPLAAAEAFAYGADAILRIDPADLEALGRMLAFLRTVDGPAVPPLANICVADDGSPDVLEPVSSNATARQCPTVLCRLALARQEHQHRRAGVVLVELESRDPRAEVIAADVARIGIRSALQRAPTACPAHHLATVRNTS